MKKSYLYGMLSVGWELRKKEKQNKWKGIVKTPQEKMKNKEKNKERQHTLGWEEKMMLDFDLGCEQK